MATNTFSHSFSTFLLIVFFYVRCSICASRSWQARTDSSRCPDGEHVMTTGMCYYYHSSGLTWQGAVKACREKGGLLATFSTVLSTRSVLSNVAKLETRNPARLIWLGVHRRADDTYTNTEGDPMPNWWRSGIQLSDSEVTEQEGCVAVNTTPRLVFVLKDCLATSLAYLCMVDTRWTQWGSWGACSATCGSATRKRQRQCQGISAFMLGRARSSSSDNCSGQDTQTDTCILDKCFAKVYEWQAWEKWGACSKTCGQGDRSRFRHCVDKVNRKKASQADQCQGSKSNTGPCNIQACSVYEWQAWEKWGACSKTCGQGDRSRSRRCVDSVSGKETSQVDQCQGSKSDTGPCNKQACPVYEWQAWEKWGACSKTCGQGDRSRSRRCVDSVSGIEASQADPCQGSKSDTGPCSNQACPVYEWQAWEKWGACSKTCGQGDRSRSRRCVDSVSGIKASQADQCQGSKSDTGPCNKQACSVYEWQAWEMWETCSKTCGQGDRSRFRHCVDKVSRKEATQADQCQGSKSDTGPCNKQACPVYEWQAWEMWGACSKTCGQGDRSRSRHCVDKVSRKEESQAYQCQGSKSDTGPCNKQACPVYEWQAWEMWGACSKTCGQGNRSRFRHCVDKVSRKEASQADKCQGSKSDTSPCSKQACPEAEWEAWQQWTACSNICGRGTRQRVRVCAQDKVNKDPKYCHGKESATKTCVTRCKGLTKQELVRKLRSQLQSQKAVVELEAWAAKTQHMNENVFNARGLKYVAISGHVLATHAVSSRMDCVMKCMSLGCKSFNLQLSVNPQGLYTCELNSVNRDEAVANVERRDDFILYDLKPFIPFIDEDEAY